MSNLKTVYFHLPYDPNLVVQASAQVQKQLKYINPPLFNPTFPLKRGKPEEASLLFNGI